MQETLKMLLVAIERWQTKAKTGEDGTVTQESIPMVAMFLLNLETLQSERVGISSERFAKLGLEVSKEKILEVEFVMVKSWDGKSFTRKLQNIVYTGSKLQIKELTSK